ncbi:hypothetical protein diail_9334 [Diaporthe ilicicola]|nr:hypothetical protein diail_9334 [Diaporthe ilicicola]
MDIVELPRDLFLLVVAHLSARTAVLCRRVSRNWKGAFTDPDLNLQLMKWHFPRCREMRMAYMAGALGGPVSAQAEGDTWPSDWTATFASVARRYYHLRTATPWSVEAFRLGSTEDGPSRNFYPVAIWDRFLRLDDKTAPFHYRDPAWSYSRDDGLLVYQSSAAAAAASCPWRLLDLETGREAVVPFPQGEDRIVRRVRLCDRVLVLEWCERDAYHQLNDREECHRHFVTAFDVVREGAGDHDAASPDGSASSSSSSSSNYNGANPSAADNGTWTVRHRSQFKTHFLGFPLNRHDRFFSAHTATHYAVYVWQPNRSLYNDDPIESVIVWDISAPDRPRTIRRITWDTLAFYGVRQGSTPRLRSLRMDARNLYVAEEEHRWAEGGHSSLAPPRVHLVRSTGIPVVPEGAQQQQQPKPGWHDDDGAEEVVVQGPRWVDQCGTNTDVNMPFCTRAAEAHFGGLSARLSSSSVAPPGSSSSSSSRSIISISSSGRGGRWKRGSLAAEIEAGIAAPMERWPGWAPCWRHEDFPYLSVDEMVDFRAGVRVTARQCFMLETLSIHVRPSISVVELSRGGGGGDPGQDESGSSSDGRTSSAGGDGGGGGGEYASSAARVTGLERRLRAGMGGRKPRKRRGAWNRKKDADESSPDEVHFEDDMWDRLLGKGRICGDERWLIGEDGKGTLSVLRF